MDDRDHSLSAREAERLAVLSSYNILDTPPDVSFDEIVELAARACGTPMAAVTLVDADRQWFKARRGVEVAETQREHSFCARAIEDPTATMVIEDATADPRFRANPFVTGEPTIRAYAGVPLIGADDHPLGALCVIDDRPRRFAEDEIEALCALARRVEALLELRRVSLQWETELDDARFALAFRRAPVPMNLVAPDGTFIRVNEAMTQLVGFPSEALVGRPVHDVIAAEDHAAEHGVLDRLIKGELDSAARSGAVLTSDGSTVPVHATTTAVRDPSGTLLFFLTYLEDLSHRIRAEDALTLTHTAIEGIVASDANGEIVFWNSGAATMFGYRASEVMGRPVTLIIPERYQEDHLAAMSRLARGGAPRLIGQTIEAIAVRANGEEFPVELSLSQWSSRGEDHFTAMVRDITDRRRLQDEMVRRADVDELTGLASRERLARDVAAAVDAGADATVILLDLDQFKLVNDSLGYAAGDDVLKALAARLGALVPKDVVVARAGGDEFGFLLPADVGDAKRLAAVLLESLQQPIECEGRQLTVGACVGIAAINRGQAPRTAIREADTAMHRAKTAGRGRVEVFDDRLRLAALERLKLDEDLRHAIGHGGLDVHYQTEYDVETGRPCALEALVRWSRPGRGSTPPDQFIPIAEETGLILPLGRWVLRRTLKDLAVLDLSPKTAGLTVAVNVSIAQLADPAFVSDVIDALQAAHVGPDRLCLEITESAAMDDPSLVQARLGELTALGVTIAVDDFGTGHSSLAVLHRLPVSVLKIDKSFIDPLPAAGTATVRTIVTLARALGLSTVAEGIERPDQLRCLTDLGVDTAQGFLLARPVPVGEVESQQIARPQWPRRQATS